jgi:hypothetical protein
MAWPVIFGEVRKRAVSTADAAERGRFDWILAVLKNTRDSGGGGGSRTRVRKCYWSRDYMLIHVHALGITPGRSRPPLRTDKKRRLLACDLSLSAQT